MKKIFILLLLTGVLFQSCKDKLITTSGNLSENNDYQKARRAEVLFLGHASDHHPSRKYAPWLATAVFASGINITYTEELADLNSNNLAKYDGLVIYANHDYLAPEQENALKVFLDQGKGLIPLHSASGCFKNSDWYIHTIGGQFASHGTGDFIAEIVEASHPILDGVDPFETWDETYVHKNLNPDIEVLTERVEHGKHEPYTWMREEGNGRVFYTAYGHNDSTWTNGSFQKLVENGIFWAMGDRVKAQVTALDIPEVSIYEESISDFTKRHEVPKMQEPLNSEESRKLIQTPVDFEIQLFASEPDIVNPISMAWDERGRLWVIEAVDYPNTFKETDGLANDRITICEDTNGDGKADKFTVFADNLNIPTSLVFANGGVIASMAPDFVFLKDTTGDDVADVREVIMTGWGKQDTHAGPSNLQYGFDNKIWGVTGYSGFNGTINGKPMRFPQGVYHFDPDGENFEYLASTSNNTWGLGLSEENNVFISTANNTHAAYYSIPAKYLQRTFPAAPEGDHAPPFAIQPVQKIDGHYEGHAMTPNLRQVDVVGGFTSAAGFNLYTARDFPKEYWNRIAFVSEPTIRLTHNAIIEPQGAGFQEKDGWNLLASSDEWFGPVHAEVGPDGAVWVADWYNFIIQHNVFVERQAPSRMVLPFEDQPHGQGNAFESQLRDTNHGRIYRVVYKNAKSYDPIQLSKEDPKGLVKALESDNMFWRMTAQRLLVESENQSVTEDLYALIGNAETDEIGLNSPAVHALWTLHGLGLMDGPNEEALQAAFQALRHPAAGVRKAAVEVLPSTDKAVLAILGNDLILDEDLNVRMHAILALVEMPSSDAVGEMIYKASRAPENAKDDWITKALFAAATHHPESFLAAANKEASQTGSLTARLVEAVSNEIYELGRRSALQFSPDVVGKEVIITTTVSVRGDQNPEGVIVAQGNKSNGYVLYIENGQVNFVVNQKDQPFKAITSASLPEEYELTAHLSNDGQMSVVVDGEKVAQAKAPGLFDLHLDPSVRSGRDLGDHSNVGSYEDENTFEGNFQDLKLELK